VACLAAVAATGVPGAISPARVPVAVPVSGSPGTITVSRVSAVSRVPTVARVPAISGVPTVARVPAVTRIATVARVAAVTRVAAVARIATAARITTGITRAARIPGSRSRNPDLLINVADVDPKTGEDGYRDDGEKRRNQAVLDDVLAVRFPNDPFQFIQ
jgi:hypothetical protein